MEAIFDTGHFQGLDPAIIRRNPSIMEAIFDRTPGRPRPACTHEGESENPTLILPLHRFQYAFRAS
jgi:hypothetical protein